MNPQDLPFQESAPAKPPEGGSAGPSAPTRSASREEMVAQLRTAQRNVSNLLIMLLVVSGTLCMFLVQQVRYDRADLNGLRAQDQQVLQARQIIADYNQRTIPAVQSFLKQLGEYSKAHPDVLPIMLKYGLVQPKVPEPETPTPTGQKP